MRFISTWRELKVREKKIQEIRQHFSVVVTRIMAADYKTLKINCHNRNYREFRSAFTIKYKSPRYSPCTALF